MMRQRAIRPALHIASLTCAFLFLFAETASAQSLSIQGGSIVLTCSTGNPGVGITPNIDSRVKIRFRQATVPAKIAVQTVCPGQNFNLSVVATSTAHGTPAPVVTLSDGMLPTDFITNIGTGSRKIFSVNLEYTASALFSQGNSTVLGDDIHTVTYTLVAQ